MDTKTCQLCKTVKPTSDYSPDRFRKDGFASRCKICLKHYQRERRNAKTDSHREAILTALTRCALDIDQIEDRFGSVHNDLRSLKRQDLIQFNQQTGLYELTAKGRAQAPCRNPHYAKRFTQSQEMMQ